MEYIMISKEIMYSMKFKILKQIKMTQKYNRFAIKTMKNIW